jgi:hypothetical protein
VALHGGIRGFVGRFNPGRGRRGLRFLTPASESSPDLAENGIDSGPLEAGPEKTKTSGAQWPRNNGLKKANQIPTLIKYRKIMNDSRSQRSASSAAPAKKSARTKSTSNSVSNVVSTKGKVPKKVSAQPSSEQVALRAYFIGERRRTLGIHGDETSDWVAAERELLEEIKAK